MANHPPIEDEASDDPTPVGPMRVARLRKKNRPPIEGSIGTSLKAMDVLYDAGEPLTSQDLEARLIPRLDPYERSYLLDWHEHARNWRLQYDRRHRKTKSLEHASPCSNGSIEQAVHAWISQVFLVRLRNRSHTLERTADGKLRPGTGAPRMARADGRVLPYTPETRKQFAAEDRETHRQYLADVEWTELLQKLALSDQASRAQLLTMLVRRLLIGPNKSKAPLDERLIGPKLDRLVWLADTPAVQKAVLQRAFDALWTSGDAR